MIMGSLDEKLRKSRHDGGKEVVRDGSQKEMDIYSALSWSCINSSSS